MEDVVTALDAGWERVLKERRSGAGLREALDTLRNALKTARAESGEDTAEKDDEAAALLEGVLDAAKDQLNEEDESPHDQAGAQSDQRADSGETR
jgi:hypothetical protein